MGVLAFPACGGTFLVFPLWPVSVFSSRRRDSGVFSECGMPDSMIELPASLYYGRPCNQFTENLTVVCLSVILGHPDGNIRLRRKLCYVMYAVTIYQI